MEYEYVLTETIYYIGGRTRSCYGIAAVSVMDNVTVIAEIAEISNEESNVRYLVNLFNQEKLDIVHFQNAIEDYLSSCV